MTPQQHRVLIEEITTHTAGVVREVVNGKIDAIQRDFDVHRNTFENYVKSDMEWKQSADPAIKAFNNLTGAGKIVIAIAIGIAAVVGAFLAVKGLWK